MLRPASEVAWAGADSQAVTLARGTTTVKPAMMVISPGVKSAIGNLFFFLKKKKIKKLGTIVS